MKPKAVTLNGQSKGRDGDGGRDEDEDEVETETAGRDGDGDEAETRRRRGGDEAETRRRRPSADVAGDVDGDGDECGGGDVAGDVDGDGGEDEAETYRDRAGGGPVLRQQLAGTLGRTRAAAATADRNVRYRERPGGRERGEEVSAGRTSLPLPNGGAVASH